MLSSMESLLASIEILIKAKIELLNIDITLRGYPFELESDDGYEKMDQALDQSIKLEVDTFVDEFQK